MAAKTTVPEEDITCPQCTDIYCLPVLLKCGHNICRVCLFNYWEWKGLRECPVCGIVSDTGRPPINLALHNVAKEHKVLIMTSSQNKCCQHNEKLKIFCHNDGELICLICKISKEHKVHECSPVEEAAEQKKAEISASLESLQNKLKTLKNTKQKWEETKTYIKTQAYENETAIKEEFKKFHQFLREEENTRLKVLKLEEETKIQIMCKKLENISDQINTLSSTISDIEKALKAQDIQLLQDYKKTKKRLQCSIGEPEVIRDILINSAKHLGSLSFQIWKKMEDIVRCVPVVLDPNTAQFNLELSEELSCVQYSSKKLLPNNTERLINRVSVLGATGFTSGKHSWTVDVGQGKDWYIGVALDSIQRKNTIFLSPAEGFWVIGLSNGDSLWAQTTPRSKLPMKEKPNRITVELDYERGKVIFINAADSTKIHTFKDKFTEKVFPYFSPGLCEDKKKSSKLKICPQVVKVQVE
ncbi:zinc-binding protein A33-like [Oreochromis aureus]|uniref:Zinc-binding protein A33-like n=1 Tax=Oreochromis aureus TaxID=47969 RepID=A0A668U6Y4_OREAU|nr:zinc-binding protein A33-like [Oreochromis aureus]